MMSNTNTQIVLWAMTGVGGVPMKIGMGNEKHGNESKRGIKTNTD